LLFFERGWTQTCFLGYVWKKKREKVLFSGKKRKNKKIPMLIIEGEGKGLQ